MIRIIIAALATLLLVSGCSKKPEPKTAATGAGCVIEGANAPKWVCIPQGPDAMVAGLGTAAKNPANDYGFQLSQAQAAGRDALARNIETKVQNLFKNWQRSTGVAQSATFEQNVENVSRQSANMSLQGSRIEDSWQHPVSGTLYVLMVAPENQVREGMLSSLRNEEALWQQFQSQKAHDELMREFDREMGR